MTAENPADGVDLIGKLDILVRRYAAARDEFQQVETEDAVSRTRLAVALTEAMAARARVEREAREVALAGFTSAAGRLARPRRRARIDAQADKALDQLRSLGRALVIARSGLWEGPPARGPGALRAMAAYARRGADPAVQPLALFDQAWYLRSRADLAGTAGSPMVHYLLHGGFEGASPHPLFDPLYYQARNDQALAASGLTPLEHFLRKGASQARDPHPLFSIGHYVRQAPDLIASGQNPVLHYLQDGWRRGLSPHPLFSPDFYMAQAQAGDMPPLVHYLTLGSGLGLKPHPLFDPAWYLAAYPDVAGGGFEPLSHFLSADPAERRRPGPWFDTERYMELRGADLAPGRNALVDYLEGGAWSVGEPWPGQANLGFLFAAAELAASGMTPLEHWARQGEPQIPSA